MGEGSFLSLTMAMNMQNNMLGVPSFWRSHHPRLIALEWSSARQCLKTTNAGVRRVCEHTHYKILLLSSSPKKQQIYSHLKRPIANRSLFARDLFEVGTTCLFLCGNFHAVIGFPRFRSDVLSCRTEMRPADAGTTPSFTGGEVV